MAEALPPDLQDLADQLDAADREARALVVDLDDAQANWQPDGGASWSVAQCLDHLAVTNRTYVEAMEEALPRARGRGRVRRGPARPGILAALFVRSLEPPVRRRTRNPRVIAPDVRASARRGARPLPALAGGGTAAARLRRGPRPFGPVREPVRARSALPRPRGVPDPRCPRPPSSLADAPRARHGGVPAAVSPSRRAAVAGRPPLRLEAGTFGSRERGRFAACRCSCRARPASPASCA